jgi:glucose/arabinose dehydrogenase
MNMVASRDGRNIHMALRLHKTNSNTTKSKTARASDSMRRGKAGLNWTAGLALAAAAALGIAAVTKPANVSAQEKALGKYDSTAKNFWLHPPDDWWRGDETEAQRGLVPNPGQPLSTPLADLEKQIAGIKVPAGFKLSVWAADVPQARQMAWGDKGTLFVGTWDAGTVTAVVDSGGKRVVKSVIKGLRQPTCVAFSDHTLYVVDIDKVYAWENPEDHLDSLGAGKVVYDDFPPYTPHGWKYIIAGKEGELYIPVGPPCNECLPPSGTAQYRRINPKNGNSELWAIGQRNSVGGDIDPRTGKLWFSENARDWLGDDLPSDKLNMVSKTGEDFGYPYCHQGDILDPVYGKGHQCSEFTPPVAKLGPHVAPLGMKFYTGNQFPAEYKDNIFIALHGSWNRHAKNGYRIERVIANPDGTGVKQEAFTGTFLDGSTIVGRPSDIIVAPDGSLLVSDDQAGAIYQISYSK